MLPVKESSHIQQSPTSETAPNSDAYPDFLATDAELNPLKYTGYRVFSRWIALDQNYFIVRRFGALAARSALSLQDQIVEYEEELDRIDKECSSKKSASINNGSFRHDVVARRKKLVGRLIPNALSRYYTFLEQFSAFIDRSQPGEGAVNDVRGWLRNHEITYRQGLFDDIVGPIDQPEVAYLNKIHDNDLVAIRPEKKTPMRQALSRPLFLRIKGIRELFYKRPEGWEEVDPTDNAPASVTRNGSKPFKYGTVIWAKDKDLDKLAKYLTALAALVMLTCPLWILNYVRETNGRLGIITCFVAVFYTLMSTTTTASPSEIMAAVAAYSAVLTVFLTVGASSS